MITESVVSLLFPGFAWRIPFQIDPRFAVIGSTFLFRLRKSNGAEITLTTTTIEITDRTTGTGLLTILDADTILLTEGTFFFRLIRTNIHRNHTVWFGLFHLEPLPPIN
jgi:hypothetical protein